MNLAAQRLNRLLPRNRHAAGRTPDALLGVEPLAIGDLILTEVLQRFQRQSDFDRALAALNAFTLVEIAGPDVALQAARNYRTLRGLGVTLRKTIDTLIATRCIESGYALLFSDRDFEPFVEHLGLVSAMV